MPGMQDFMLSLTPGVEERIRIDGDYFQVMEAGSPIELLFDEQGSWQKRVQGQGNAVDDYNNAMVRSDVQQTVRVSLGYGGKIGPVNGAGSFSGTVAATFEAPNEATANAVTTVPGNGSAVIAAASASRLSLRLSVPSDAPGAVLLSGASGAQDGYGGLLEAGMTDYLPTAGPVSAFNPNAEAVEVYALELGRV